jgi:hypothetical protein
MNTTLLILTDQKKAELDRIVSMNAETSSRIRAFKEQSRQASLTIATSTLQYAVSSLSKVPFDLLILA